MQTERIWEGWGRWGKEERQREKHLLYCFTNCEISHLLWGPGAWNWVLVHYNMYVLLGVPRPRPQTIFLILCSDRSNRGFHSCSLPWNHIPDSIFFYFQNEREQQSATPPSVGFPWLLPCGAKVWTLSLKNARSCAKPALQSNKLTTTILIVNGKSQSMAGLVLWKSAPKPPEFPWGNRCSDQRNNSHQPRRHAEGQLPIPRSIKGAD